MSKDNIIESNENSNSNQNSISVAYCNVPIQLRETEGEYYVDGWIYTTHPDRANDGDSSVSNTMFTKKVMQQIADSINNGVGPVSMIGARRTVSDEHDWIKEQDSKIEPIGMAIPPVEVREYVDINGKKDGHWGVYGTTHFKKQHPKFAETRTDIEKGYKPGFSIEFIEGESEKVTIGERVIKIIKSLKEFLGYGLASARLIANPKALITSFSYREVEDIIDKNLEENIMPEEEKIDIPTEEAKAVTEEAVEVREAVQEEIKAEPVVAKEEVEVREVIVEKELDINEIVSKIRESPEFIKSVEDIKIRSKVIKQEDKMEDIKIRQINEALESNDVLKYRNIMEQLESETQIVSRTLNNPSLFKPSTLKTRCVGKGVRVLGGIQVRGTLDSGSNTETTYDPSPVEFADIFQPGMNDIVNSASNFFGFLEKVDHVGGKLVQWKNVVDRDPLSNSSSVDFDDVVVAKNYSDKINLQTEMKVYSRGVSVADTTLRYSAQSLQPLFEAELQLQLNEMMVDLETDLFDEQVDTAGTKVLGLEAVADVTGNTSIYGKVRSATNKLTTGTLADTYVNQAAAITETAIRNGITKLETLGSQIGRLAIVTSPKGKNYLFNLLDGNRRFNNTMAEFGFNQMSVPSYDEIPIITSWKCDSTLATASSSSACLYIIDRDQDKIVMGMAPTIIDLAKTGRATEAYVEMHLVHQYKDVRKIHMIDNFTTG